MTIHQNLSAGAWEKMSLAEQLGNIGSDIHRALRWQQTDPGSYNQSVMRAMELLDLTIRDSRWKTRLKELTRIQEVLGDAITGGTLYASTLEKLDNYLTHFAVAARIKKFKTN